MRKQYIAAALIASLSAYFLTGCFPNNETSTSSSEETQEITVTTDYIEYEKNLSSTSTPK